MDLISLGGRLVVLVARDVTLEGALLAAASRYNEPLSHLMQADCDDAIIILSRCRAALTQPYVTALWLYSDGSPHRHLADTMIDDNHAAIAVTSTTSVQFQPGTLDGLRQELRRTVRYYKESKQWMQMQKLRIKSDVSWEKPWPLCHTLKPS